MQMAIIQHIHSGYTAKFFHDYLHLNDQLEKASSGHHINEVDEFDSIIRDADRIASKIDRNDENFDFEGKSIKKLDINTLRLDYHLLWEI